VTDHKFSLSLSLRVSVCLSALSRSHFLIDFRQEWHRGKKPQKKERVCWGGQHRTSSSTILPTKPPFWPKGPKNPCKNINMPSSALNVHESYGQLGSKNTIVMSDFRPEVEIRQFRACALKNMQHNHNLWQTSIRCINIQHQ